MKTGRRRQVFEGNAENLRFYFGKNAKILRFLGKIQQKKDWKGFGKGVSTDRVSVI